MRFNQRSLRSVWFGAGTAIYETVDKVSTLLAGRVGPESDRPFTEEKDNESSINIDQAIARALSRQVSIFTVGHGPAYAMGAFKNALDKLALQTGGFPYGSLTSNALVSLAQLIAPQITTLYALQYTSSARLPQAEILLTAQTGSVQRRRDS